MGLTVSNLEHYVAWAKQGWLPKGGRILDIGAQQINASDDPESLDRYVLFFGGTPLTSEERTRISNNGYVGELHTKAGFKYASFDVTTDPHVINVDLNFGTVPFFHRAKYDLVTNHGTTEHVPNQLNAMKIIHDATATGGLMHHIIPMVGDCAHGFINYNPKFFWALAEANDYAIHTYRLWVRDTVTNMADIMTSGIEFENPCSYTDAWAHILLKKKSARSFRPFTDPAFKDLKLYA
jgi:hypothetical protein